MSSAGKENNQFHLVIFLNFVMWNINEKITKDLN